MAQLPNIITLLRIAGSLGLLLCDVTGVALAMPSSVTTRPSPSEFGWLSLCSIIPIAIVAAIATFAAIQEGLRKDFKRGIRVSEIK